MGRPRKVITKKQAGDIERFITISLVFAFTALWFFALLLIFVIIFFIKTIVNTLVRLIKKKGKIFYLTSAEKKVYHLMIAPLKLTSDLMSSHSKILSHRNSSSREEKGNYCEICGASLRSRKKYCSKCRPTYKTKPLSDEERWSKY